MECEKCNTKLKIIDFIKSDGTTNRPTDRVIAQCPGCNSVTSTIYNPKDWYTKKQLRVIERLMRRRTEK